MFSCAYVCTSLPYGHVSSAPGSEHGASSSRSSTVGAATTAGEDSGEEMGEESFETGEEEELEVDEPIEIEDRHLSFHV